MAAAAAAIHCACGAPVINVIMIILGVAAAAAGQRKRANWRALFAGGDAHNAFGPGGGMHPHTRLELANLLFVCTYAAQQHMTKQTICQDNADKLTFF